MAHSEGGGLSSWLVVANFGQLPIIRNGVLNNSVNAPTLELVWGQRAELITFIVEIVECTKCFVAADGSKSPIKSRIDYNELDVTKPMNRHGMICQVQRLPTDIDMTKDTTLDSDLTEPPLTEYIADAPEEQEGRSNEHWFFINGIGGEYNWLALPCQKLAN
ncbi:hypothetical protein OQA88_12871 [Cercophora sp. LCS_1]